MTNRDIVAIPLFSALLIGSGLLPPIPVPYIPVPITAQTLAISLIGGLLGSKRGFIAVGLVFIMAAMGLPVLAGGKGSISSFIGPTAGYLFGFLIAAFLIGKIYETYKPRSFLGEFLALFLGGSLIIHILGILWLSFYTKMDLFKVFLGDMVFMPGDLIKIVLAILIMRIIRRSFPDAFHS